MNNFNFYRDVRVVASTSDFRSLIGLPSLFCLLGDYLANKVLERCKSLQMDKCTMKFRRGLKIEIYVK